MKKLNVKQSFVYHDYYSRLKNIALSCFKWEGLPETCNEKFLEKCLFEYGQAVFVNDPDMSFLNLKVTPADTLNVYHEPLSYRAFSIGYNKSYKADDCIIVRNNRLSKSTDSTIMLFAERLARIELSIGVNINAQKTPILIKCDKKTQTTLEAIYDQYTGDKPVIFGFKSLQEKPLETLTTGAPFVADKLREEKRAVWNEALEFLGINTNPSDKKKERVIVAEVDSNNEQIDIQALSMELCRQEACEAFNKLWGGHNLKCVRRLKTLDDLKHIYQGEEGKEDGEIYN